MNLKHKTIRKMVSASELLDDLSKKIAEIPSHTMIGLQLLYSEAHYWLSICPKASLLPLLFPALIEVFDTISRLGNGTGLHWPE